MAVTSATVETAVEALITAIGVNDYSAARVEAVKVRAYLTLLPDYGIGSRNLRYDRNAITKLLDDIDRLEADARAIHGGMTTVADLTEP